MKIDAATFVDSAPDVPIVRCMIHATTLITCCITPMWYRIAKNALTKMIVGSTANANTLSGLLGIPRYPNTSPDPSAECPSSPVITPETLLSTVCPYVHLITAIANTICSPNPHTTVFHRIARRLVEKAYDKTDKYNKSEQSGKTSQGQAPVVQAVMTLC